MNLVPLGFRASSPAPLPSRVHASCARGEQTAAAPEQSQELRSTPTQERETVATAGVGPRHREGEEKEARAHAPLSLPGLPGQGYRALISPVLPDSYPGMPADLPGPSRWVAHSSPSFRRPSAQPLSPA